MLWTIISESDVFYSAPSAVNSVPVRSSNPYDYIRRGYFVDGASTFGGNDNVSFNSYISGNRAGAMLDITRV